MMRPLVLQRIVVRDLRNIEHLEIDPSPRFNVIHGDNGQGKTNTIEAIYLVATSRSFRTARLSELVRHGGEHASVRAILNDDVAREQSVGLTGNVRTMSVDGARPRSAAAYASRTPVVVFSPASLALSTGSSRERRVLLDRVALYEDPASLDEAAAYQRAVRERQRALEDRGAHARDLEQWEEIIVRHGLSVMRARASATTRIMAAARAVFEQIGIGELTGAYDPSASFDAGSYRTALVDARPRDLQRGAATTGPHRDDVSLRIGGMLARTTASQGQHRALVLALKAAELTVIAQSRHIEPILLLDDVSSELDVSRTTAFFAYLTGQRGQVFLTTTRRELIALEKAAMDQRRDFRIVGGHLVP